MSFASGILEVSMDIISDKKIPIISPPNPTPALNKFAPKDNLNEKHPPEVVTQSQCTVIDRPKTRGKNKFNYNIAKDEYINNRLEAYQIRDKYNLKPKQYRYLGDKIYKGGWRKLQLMKRVRIGEKTEELVAINSAENLNRIADTIKKLLATHSNTIMT